MNILVPTDFSETAWHTFKRTVEMYAHLNCQYVLLNVYQISNSSSGDIIAVNDQLKKDAESKLYILKSKAISYFDIKAEDINFYAIHGNFIRVLNRILTEESFDLVAISGVSKNYPDGISHHNLSAKVLEVATCPLVVVPQYC